MKLQDYDERDGKKVWLSGDEVAGLLDAADGTEQKLALAFGARCGLRAAETAAVTPNDVVEAPAGPRVRVWEGKGDKYREDATAGRPRRHRRSLRRRARRRAGRSARR